jgi:hypothetical protein
MFPNGGDILGDITVSKLEELAQAVPPMLLNGHIFLCLGHQAMGLLFGFEDDNSIGECAQGSSDVHGSHQNSVVSQVGRSTLILWHM